MARCMAIHNVEPWPTVEYVWTTATPQAVIPCQANEDIRTVAANELVVARSAHNGIRSTLSISASVMCVRRYNERKANKYAHCQGED